MALESPYTYASYSHYICREKKCYYQFVFVHPAYTSHETCVRGFSLNVRQSTWSLIFSYSALKYFYCGTRNWALGLSWATSSAPFLNFETGSQLLRLAWTGEPAALVSQVTGITSVCCPTPLRLFHCFKIGCPKSVQALPRNTALFPTWYRISTWIAFNLVKGGSKQNHKNFKIAGF